MLRPRPVPRLRPFLGDIGAAITLFVGSILFTIGGALQTWLAWAERHASKDGRAAWWTAVTQSVGALAFNVTTLLGIITAVPSVTYDRLVWRPDAFGSVCFLISGAIAYRASLRHGWLPARTGRGWWEPGTNLVGCILFGISAVAGYVVPGTGTMIDLAASNWNTSLGAACFLACAVATLWTGGTAKIPRFRLLSEIEYAVERDVGRIV